MYKVTLLILIALFLTSCVGVQPQVEPVTHTQQEVTGTTAERVATITALLTPLTPLPTQFLDAHFVEEKIGDDRLGPADYRAFTRLTVAPADMTAWQALLTPLDSAPAYQAPAQAYDWWLEEARFAELDTFAPAPLSGRANGWIAIDPAQGHIFIFSFTT